MVLKKVDIRDFERIFEIMDLSFPNTEMRTKEGQKKLFENKAYSVVMDEKKNGFLSYWTINGAAYLEHFAVDEVARGGGYGRLFLETYLNTLGKFSFMEVELPETDIAKRRIGFYQRMGFKLNGFSYIQPALREDEEAIPLMIMTYGRELSEEEFEPYKKELYKQVYGV